MGDIDWHKQFLNKPSMKLMISGCKYVYVHMKQGICYSHKSDNKIIQTIFQPWTSIN